MAKIRKEWIKDLNEADPRLTNGSNCDELHYHSQIKNNNNVLQITSSEVEYKDQSGEVFTIVHPKFIRCNQDQFQFKPVDLSSVELDENSIALDEEKRLRLFYINDPRYFSFGYVSLHELCYYDKFDETSVSTRRYYLFGSPDGRSGIYFKDPVLLIGLSLSISRYSRRSRRKRIEIRANNSIHQTITPTTTDLYRRRVYYDLSVLIRDANFNISIYRTNDSRYDYWNYVVITVYFRRLHLRGKSITRRIFPVFPFF